MSLKRTQKKAIRWLFNFSNVNIFWFFKMLPMLSMLYKQFWWDIADSVDLSLSLRFIISFLSQLIIHELQCFFRVINQFDSTFFISSPELILIKNDSRWPEKFTFLSKWINRSTFSKLSWILKLEYPIRKFRADFLHSNIFKNDKIIA